MDREKIARYGINVSDVEGVIQAGVGGQAATQVIQGEQLFDLVVRMKPEYRSSTHDIGNLLVPTPSGQQVPISELAKISQGNGASFIYRENNSRYIGVQFSIEGRDLARAVDDAQKAVRQSVVLPQGYTLDWGGEYSEYVAARQQIAIIGPLAILLIFMILFALYGNFKFPVTVMIGVVMTEPVGALLALKLTHTHLQRLLRARPCLFCWACPRRRPSSTSPTSISCAWRARRSAKPPWKARCCACGPS